MTRGVGHDIHAHEPGGVRGQENVVAVVGDIEVEAREGSIHTRGSLHCRGIGSVMCGAKAGRSPDGATLQVQELEGCAGT
jgi:hypothetical protein